VGRDDRRGHGSHSPVRGGFGAPRPPLAPRGSVAVESRGSRGSEPARTGELPRGGARERGTRIGGCPGAVDEGGVQWD
jgi:hypothetical protein